MFLKLISFALALLTVQLCHNQTPIGRLIPRSLLVAHPDKSSVKLSHDGKRISYIARNGGNIELCITDLNGKLIRSFKIKPARNVGEYVWAHTNNHILILQDTNGDENDHVICLNIQTGKQRDLHPQAKSKSIIAKLSKSSPNDIIILNNSRDKRWFDAYRVNILSGSSKLIFENNCYGDLIFDSNLSLRFASKVLSDGSSETYFIENNKKTSLFRKASFEDSKNEQILHMNKDGNLLYLIKCDNRNTGALYEYNIKESKYRLLFGHNLADVSNVCVNPQTLAPQLVSVEYLAKEDFTIDKSIEKDISFLKKFSKKSYLHILNRSDNDNLWIVCFSSDVQSSKYYLYDRKKNRLKFLFSAQPELDRYVLQPTEPVIIKSRDGLDLVCYLTKSPGSSKLIVYVHGGPWSRSRKSLFGMVQLLVNRGYSVLQVNYRGSTGFGKSFINAANKNLDKIRNDIIDATKWAIDHDVADRNKIAIMGGSFGGYSALAGLAFTPNVFCCGIDIVGPSNWATVVKTVPEYWIPFMTSWYRLIGYPDTPEGKVEMKKHSPITFVDKIKKPLIIFQGEQDPRVNKAESDQIVAQLKNKNLKVAYVLYPDEGHGFLREPNRISYIALTEKFLSTIMNGWFEPIHEKDIEGSSHKIIQWCDD